jgi:outer membrane lipoprotein-sorting protein
MKKLKSNIFIAIIVFAGFLKGQTYKEDMLKLNKSYMSLKKFSYTANYTMYSGNSTIPSETYYTLFKKNNDQYYSKSPDDEYLVNDKYILFIDHEDKDVFIQPNIAKKNTDINSFINNTQGMEKFLDTLIDVYKNVQAIASNFAGTRGYKFSYNEGPYTRIDLIIDTKVWLIKEMVLYYAEKDEVDGKEQDVRIKIDYSNYNINPVFTNEFSETAYLQVQNGKFKLKPAFSKYEFYDQTHLQ